MRYVWCFKKTKKMERNAVLQWGMLKPASTCSFFLTVVDWQQYKWKMAGILTFLAFQGHPWFQVVHLQLETFKGTVSISRLPFVCNKDNYDDEQEKSASSTNANNGWQSQQVVRIDQQRSWGELKPPSLNLEDTKREKHPILLIAAVLLQRKTFILSFT